MKRVLLITAVMATFLTGCQKERLDAGADGAASRGSGAIGFSAYSQKTKASIAYLDDLQDDGFGVFGFINQVDSTSNPGKRTPTMWESDLWANFFKNNAGLDTNVLQEVNYTSGAWTYDPVMYWPDDDLTSLDFFAVSPLADHENTPYGWSYKRGEGDLSAAKIGDFKVDSIITDQTDLLLATKFNTPQVSKVLLEFKHALSRIGFSAYYSGDNPITIQKIQLRGAGSDTTSPKPFFQKKGAISICKKNTTEGLVYETKWDTPIDGSDQSLDANKMYFTYTTADFYNSGVLGTTPAALTDSTKYLMIIPNSNGANMEIYVEYDVQTGQSHSTKTKVFTCPINIFEMGKAYTFNFSLSMSEVVFDCQVIPWDDNAVNLSTSGDVTASSDRDGYNVYVDAVRSSKDSSIVTKYTLLAEMTDELDSETEKYMLPVWKTLNKWDQGTTGFPVEIGEQIDIYLDLYDLLLDVGEVSISDTTIGDKHYTSMSFSVSNDDTEQKSAFYGSYTAHYIADPIEAAVTDPNGVSVPGMTGVSIHRTYSSWGHPSVSESLPPEPYTVSVVLKPVGTASVDFNKWQKYDESSDEWVDVVIDEDIYTLGTGNSLLFDEKYFTSTDNTPESSTPYVDIHGTVHSNQGKYRAVYGEGGGDIALTLLSNSSGKTTHVDPNQATFEAGADVTMYAQTADAGKGEEFSWWYQAPGGQPVEITESVGGKGAAIGSGGAYVFRMAAVENEEVILIKGVTADLNGYTFWAQYGLATVTCSNKTTGGNDVAVDIVSYPASAYSNVTIDCSEIQDKSNIIIEYLRENDKWESIETLDHYGLLYDSGTSGDTIYFKLKTGLATVSDSKAEPYGSNYTLRVNNSNTFTVNFTEAGSGLDYYYKINNPDSAEVQITASSFDIWAFNADPKIEDSIYFYCKTADKALFGWTCSYYDDYDGTQKRGDTLIVSRSNFKQGHTGTIVSIPGVRYTIDDTTTSDIVDHYQTLTTNFGDISILLTPTGVENHRSGTVTLPADGQFTEYDHTFYAINSKGGPVEDDLQYQKDSGDITSWPAGTSIASSLREGTESMSIHTLQVGIPSK